MRRHEFGAWIKNEITICFFALEEIKFLSGYLVRKTWLDNMGRVNDTVI